MQFWIFGSAVRSEPPHDLDILFLIDGAKVDEQVAGFRPLADCIAVDSRYLQK